MFPYLRRRRDSLKFLISCVSVYILLYFVHRRFTSQNSVDSLEYIDLCVIFIILQCARRIKHSALSNSLKVHHLRRFQSDCHSFLSRLLLGLTRLRHEHNLDLQFLDLLALCTWILKLIVWTEQLVSLLALNFVLVHKESPASNFLFCFFFSWSLLSFLLIFIFMILLQL